MNAGAASALVAALREGVAELGRNPKGAGGSGGSAPLYGMANVTPDRGMIGEFLVAYQDVMLAP
jgi:sphinganine-1-phosphate aldolase